MTQPVRVRIVWGLTYSYDLSESSRGEHSLGIGHRENVRNHSPEANVAVWVRHTNIGIFQYYYTPLFGLSPHFRTS